MSAYEQAIRNELDYWPGVKVEFGKRSKHSQAVLHYGGSSRFVVYPDTPSDTRRGTANCLTDVRRELVNLGASRSEKKPTVRNRRHKVIGHRPDRHTLANIQRAPVKPDPFAILTTMQFSAPIPPAPQSRWKRVLSWFRSCLTH